MASKGVPKGKNYNGCKYTSRWVRQRYRKDIIHRWKRMKGCENCGYNANGVALDLDHIEPGKKAFTVSEGRTISSKRWTTVKKELSKCRVLCKNCHAVKTYVNQDTYKERSKYAR